LGEYKYGGNFGVSKHQGYGVYSAGMASYEQIFNYPRFADYYSKDEVKSFLAPILKMAKELVEPTNDDGEKIRLNMITAK
jgi:hypothetical protein